jgi:GAF domain-containing protein
VRSFLDNRQIAVEDRRATLANEHGEIARALRNLPIGSQALTPLAREGKAIGVMIVNRSEVRPFQEYELELMKGFADQAVIAIENARLLTELRQRTDDLSESLEQQTATFRGAARHQLLARRFKAGFRYHSGQCDTDLRGEVWHSSTL